MRRAGHRWFRNAAIVALALRFEMKPLRLETEAAQDQSRWQAMDRFAYESPRGVKPKAFNRERPTLRTPSTQKPPKIGWTCPPPWSGHRNFNRLSPSLRGYRTPPPMLASSMPV